MPKSSRKRDGVPSREEEADDVAAYIADRANELAALAYENRLEVIGHLLDIVQRELVARRPHPTVHGASDGHGSSEPFSNGDGAAG
jgi:hypothetical protein